MSRDIGIDFGTANVLIHFKGRGIVVNEPSVVAVDSRTQEIIEVGKKAYELIGRTSSDIKIIRPLKGGVIADFEMAEAMLVLFLEKIHAKSWFSKPNVLISYPSNISEVEQLSLVEAVERAVGGKIFIEEESKVAAIGSGINITNNQASMVIDIGGGTTDIAIISNGEIIYSDAIRIAGDDFDQAVIHYFKDKFHLLIGERTAEQIKMQLASAIELSENELETDDIKGRDLISGLPKSMNVNSNHLYEALEPYFLMIVRSAQQLLEKAEPEMIADIMEQGIILTGGGAMIYHLDTYLSEHLKIGVTKSDQPLSSVVLGTGLLLEMILSGKLNQHQVKTSSKFTQLVKRVIRKIFG